jgi:hypothetical protein
VYDEIDAPGSGNVVTEDGELHIRYSVLGVIVDAIRFCTNDGGPFPLNVESMVDTL